jgi:hypothetical protein
LQTGIAIEICHTEALKTLVILGEGFDKSLGSGSVIFESKGSDVSDITENIVIGRVFIITHFDRLSR